MQKKQTILVVASLLVIILSVSVAYFTTKILGTGKEISVESADLKVIFTSGSGTINGTNIEPGWSSGENTFTVKNESNSTYKYKIIIKDLVNTFVTEGFLQYKITSADGGYNMTDFADVPKSSTSADTTLAENISLAKGATHTYKIIINYNNSEDVDQSADMGKTLSGKIFITKASSPTLATKLLEDNPTIGTRNDFSTVFTTNTANTLYKATENGTEVYYFAGVDKMAESHCEFDGNVIWNVDKRNKLTESQCVSEIKICDADEKLFYGPSIDCENDYSGTETTVSDAEWVEAGIPINNWVIFGGFYWRIIRTNLDGSVRLLYSGTSPDTKEGYIGISEFNENYISPKYVGYMYGDTDATLAEARTNTNNSTIKTYIDNWYASNMTSYTKYLSTTAVYCNDRGVGSGTYSATGSEFNYAAYTRLDTNKTPTYDCTNNNDKFTVDASSGNGKLTYPIALMTADEIAYAGGVYGPDAPMWYYTNSSFESSTGTTSWWSLSPYNWNGRHAYSWFVFGFDHPGGLGRHDVSNSYGVRPVVSLKSCIKYSTGNGTSETPYEIVETSSGC